MIQRLVAFLLAFARSAGPLIAAPQITMTGRRDDLPPGTPMSLVAADFNHGGKTDVALVWEAVTNQAAPEFQSCPSRKSKVGLAPTHRRKREPRPC